MPTKCWEMLKISKRLNIWRNFLFLIVLGILEMDNIVYHFKNFIFKKKLKMVSTGNKKEILRNPKSFENIATVEDFLNYQKMLEI